MNNFNNNREIDLIKYLPEFLRGIRELQIILNAETPIIKEIWQACEDVMNDQFISESTENGISRRETMLGIQALKTETLADRRLRLFARYTANIPYTRKSLVNMLNSLYGEDGYELKFDTLNFYVELRLSLKIKTQKDSAQDILERLLPCNMVFLADLLYNTWLKLSPYTWGMLSNKTWHDTREEVLV